MVEITRADGGVAGFYDGIFKLSQSGGITTLTLSEALDSLRGGAAAAAAEEAQDAQAVGRRQGQVPHQGPLQRGHRARHEVARAGHVHDARITRVTQGAVTVRDAVRRKTSSCAPGKRYLARTRR